MKNDNTLILGLLMALFLLEISNQIHDIRIKRQLTKINENIEEYFAPLPDVNFEQEAQDGRTE